MKNNEQLDLQTDKVYNLVEKSNDQMTRIYIEEILFTWQWWMGILLCLLPWALWFVFRKKESTWRLLASGMFVMLISSWMDSIGTSFGLWYYYYDIIPSIPSYEPWDYSLLPVTIMFFLQIKPNSHPLIKAFIFGMLSAFIAEPFFTWIGLYHAENWKITYSFPIYICIYLIAHFINTRKHYKAL